MAVTADIGTANQTLTGSGTQDTVATGASLSEHHYTVFHNTSASSVTVQLFANGGSTRIARFTLAQNETMLVHSLLGNGDSIEAEASAGSAIQFTDGEVSLTS